MIHNTDDLESKIKERCRPITSFASSRPAKAAPRFSTRVQASMDPYGGRSHPGGH